MRSLTQRGVGLVEVLVAVLLLSVAVLGFSALQLRAISATDESLVRTKSLTLIRNLAEVMRAYPNAYVTGSGTAFTTTLPTATGAKPIVQAIATSTALAASDSTDNVTVDGLAISISGDNNCLSTEVITDPNDASKRIPKQPCNTNQLAARDTLLIKKIALEEDIKIAVVSCPAETTQQTIQQHMCIITAWNGTKAMMDDSDDKACANSSGVYNTSSHCLISEAY